MSITVPTIGGSELQVDEHATGTAARQANTEVRPVFLAEGLIPPARGITPALPPPRGTLSDWLIKTLRGEPGTIGEAPEADDDPIRGEDAALSLYLCYELHYRGLAGVNEGWEWEPSLLALRSRLESRFIGAMVDEVGLGQAREGDIASQLWSLVHQSAQPGEEAPSTSGYLADFGTLDQFREYCVHRSAYQLKEADPHTWGIPRLAGAAKAALVEIQSDEYGQGREVDMHQSLFAVTMSELGLSAHYGAYLAHIPGVSLAAVNLVSLFGLHRRWRGALCGHLALYEMTSVEPMARCVAALRRLGIGPAARHFFEVHVVADMHHETVAARGLAGALVAAEPGLGGDVLFGARAAMALEVQAGAWMVDQWRAGRSSLLMPLSAHGRQQDPAG